MKIDDRNLLLIFIALAAALVSLSLSGCASSTGGGVCHHNVFQSQPDTLEYPGERHFWNKAGLVISPARILAQVGTEVPMFAGVCDDKGQLQPFEKVEWSLDHTGVGSFASVAEANRPLFLELVSSKPKKVDDTYAITETLPDNVILTRGTPNINDDMVMPHGYTWVTVTSPREGISYVSAFAPDVYSWDVRQKSATIHWIDAEWSFPEAACAAQGNPVTLCTCVVKHTTKTPVSDWIVKYTITGGVEAGLGQNNGKSVEIATDAEGRACVEVVPADPKATGTACITVELIRSECAAAGEGERLSVATSATQVTWGISDGATSVAPATPAAPQPVSPGPAPQPIPQNVPANPAQPPVSAPQIQSQVPQNPIPQTPAQPPPAPKMELSVNGPPTAELGQDISFQVTMTNRGNAPASGLIVVDSFVSGLRHPNVRTGGNDVSPIQNPPVGSLEPIQPGDSKQVPLNFRVVGSGNLCQTVELRGPGGVVYDTKQICVNVAAAPAKPQQAAMNVAISTLQPGVTGQAQRAFYVKDRPIFWIVVQNKDASVAAEKVTLDVTFDRGLNVTQATDGFTVISGGVQFAIDRLPPSTPKYFKVECECVAQVVSACAQVAYSDSADLHLAEKFCVQILDRPPAAAAGAAGQSNLSVTIRALDKPVRQFGEGNYRITVTNNGANSEKQVQLRITLPDKMTSAAHPQGPAVATEDGQAITFSPIQEVRPNETLPPFQIRLRANSSGEAQITASVTSLNQPQPVTTSETTIINPQ